MAQKTYTPEQIINKLREAEIHLSQGSSIGEASRPKELEKENSRLKRLVADLSLENSILKEASRGNF